MRLCEILNVDRILVDADGSVVKDKATALHLLSRMLSPALGIDQAQVESLLLERERLQSTGIGDGVAIPHTAVE
jgi:PTS system nitrogen regulatory IIA component